MIPFALAFVSGAWVLQHMPFLPDGYWACMLLPMAVLVWRLPVLRAALLVVTGLLAGFFWAAFIAQYRLADALPPEWEGQNIQLIGVVASMPQQQERGERFEFDVEQVVTQNAQVPRHISLSQFSNEFASYSPQAPASIVLPPSKGAVKTGFHAGERWQLTVRLKRPHGTANPHGYDFEAWALERNIRAIGYVRKDPGSHRIQAFVIKPAYLVEAVREYIHARMSRVLAGKAYGGVLQALAIGDESGISQDNWQVFLRTGVNHLVSISGLHITMLAGFAFGLLHALWRRSEMLTLKLPARKAAVIAGAVAALLYALIAGFSVPTQRTLYMLAVFAWALWSGRHVGMARVLAYALLLVVFLDPWAVLPPGFWLSFGAVAFIGYALGGRLQRPHWLREAIHTQWAVTLGLVPLLLLMFQQVSILSPIANAIAIPVISLVVVPLTLLGALLPIDSALYLAHFVLSLCMDFLIWIAAFPLSTWQQHAPPAWTLPLAIAGVLLILLPRGVPMRWLGLLAFLPMLLLAPIRPATGAMIVTVLDVGQGLAVVVQTSQHNLLYDTGPRFSSQSDSGSKIIVPFLRGEGIRHLDAMLVSHNDSDHSGGMVSVLSQVPVDRLITSLAQDSPELSGKPHEYCLAGQRWRWDDVDFEMLYPSPESYGFAQIKDNNRSCVLRISSRYGSLLLVGDIEKEAEQELLDTVKDKLAADILVVPHHGSKTSSTAGFIAAVRPGAAIFTVGYRNRFRHPRPDVLARYAQQDAHLYRSDQDGAILLDFASNTPALPPAEHTNIRITSWRQQERRYWQ